MARPRLFSVMVLFSLSRRLARRRQTTKHAVIAREFALLQVLLTRPGTILSRDELERWTVVGHDLAALEKAVAEAEVRSERWRPEADAAVKRVAARQHWLPGTQEAIAEAEAIAEQRRQEAKVAAKRVDGLLAELFEMTSERVEMSR